MAGKRLNLVAQKLRLDSTYPGSRSRVFRSELYWRGILRPSNLSRDYVVTLKYKLKSAPRVYVVHPKLERWNGEPIPHLYRDDGRLCLYVPGRGEWKDTMRLSETIVPWSSEWLLHYEVWLATGEWTGGGEHPGEAA